jgi:class 3 adenylate cyclase
VSEHADEGVVTLMFTDVEGSTELATRLGDAEARRLVQAQRDLVRGEVEQHGGREIDAIGDGFMLSFSSTRRAVSCAIAIQRALDDEPLRLRIGLNAGEVIDKAGHPFGGAVNAAARVAGNAKGGEILVSDAVRQLAGTMPGVSFRDRGRFRLKGFPEPWRLYEVLWRDGIPAASQRLRPYIVAAVAMIVAAAAGVSAILLFTGGQKGTSSGEAAPRNDPPTIILGKSIGGVAINMSENDVERNYGDPGASGTWAAKGRTGRYATYSLHGRPFRIYYFNDKVVEVFTASSYYKSDAGINVGIPAPTAPELLGGKREWNGFLFKCGMYRASGGAAETELGLSGFGNPSQRSLVDTVTTTRLDFVTMSREAPPPFTSRAC